MSPMQDLAFDESHHCSGAYCAMTIISLLDLPLELPPDAEGPRAALLQDLTDGLPEYLSKCKTCHSW